ncbi:MAG: UDP-N-acetylglucosamine--LPS N-acetylglucosamine transferase, partial [Acidobacteriota bacterium]
RNSFLALKILRRERPDVIVSTGAAVAVPFFYLAKLFRIKTVFIEVYDRIDKPTLTGRLVYPVADAFVIQWPEQKKAFPRGIQIGQIL